MTAIKKMTEDIDCSTIDRIEVKFENDGVFSTTIETTESPEDIAIKEICSWDDEDIDIKTMKMALLMTSFKDTATEFLRGVDELVSEKDIWFDVFNELFIDIARYNKRDYYLKVVKS